MSCYDVTKDIRELVESFDSTQPLYVDTETARYYSDIRLVQLYQEHWNEKVKLIDTKISSWSITMIWDLLKDLHLVGHNFIYDLYCFKADSDDFELPKKWSDTFYLARLAFPEWGSGEYSLDQCLTRVMGYDPYEKAGLNKKVMQKSYERLSTKYGYIEGDAGLSDLTQDQYLYGSIDVLELPKLYNAVKHMEEDFVYILDIKTAEHVVTKFSSLGMPVDLDRLEEMKQKDIELCAELTQKLLNNPKKPTEPLNVNSYIQVRAVLGLQYTSDEVALSMIANKPDGLTLEDEFVIQNKGKKIEDNYIHSEEKANIARLIIAKRKALKRLNFVERAKENGYKDASELYRIKAHFSPHAITGRVQPDAENLSQYPRTMKSMWGHKPGNGRILIYADYSQLELRSICAILPERNMEEAYRQGIDLHTYAGNNLKLDESKLPEGVGRRFVAKQLNFLALYGGGKQNFQRTVCKLSNIWLPTDVVSQAFDDWKEGFSDIKNWHIRCGKSKTNMDETVSGRKYKAHKYTDLTNIKNQGSGAEVAKLGGIHYLCEYGNLEEDDCYPVNFVHDAVIIDAPDNPEVYQRVAKKLAVCFQSAWFQIMQNAPIKDLPMPVNVGVGHNWEDIEYEKTVWSYDLEGMATYNRDIEECLREIDNA